MKHTKRIFLFCTAALLEALLLGGCGFQPGSSPDATDPAEPVFTEQSITGAQTETEALQVSSMEPSAETTESPAEATDADTPAVTAGPVTEAAEAPEPFVYRGLVELAAADDRFLIDQRYATKDNFTGRIHYDRELCLVQEDVLPMLIRAADLAEAAGCRLKIWDAYRPVSVQQALHDSAPPELAAYVPAPGPWSMHARGITVDVTLCDMEGNELDMPTGFDDFSPRANSDSTDATARQIANRELLNGIMTEAGFTRSKLEWWHFDGPNRDSYEVLDVSFAEYEAARDRAE